MHIDLQSDNNVLLSLVITIIILVVLGIIYTLIRHKDKLKLATRSRGILNRPVGILIFTITRIFIGLIGIGVFMATFLPGLMPFKAYINLSLELGVLVFIFIWPLIAVQIVIAFIPYPKRWIENEPMAAWVILLVVGLMAINLDFTAMNTMYDFGYQR